MSRKALVRSLIFPTIGRPSIANLQSAIVRQDLKMRLWLVYEDDYIHRAEEGSLMLNIYPLCLVDCI